ncbi:MAG: hypothetical protein IPG59_12795 [Candidatus Melainabacteria bacterium]|nr:MAG: hypothetical protein IPG59_12795 [Candidatus Melainabacteria bacterium]
MAKYPKIKVKLSGGSSHPLSIVGAVEKALRNAGVSMEERKQFKAEALSGDYNHVICTAGEWVTTS